MIIMIKNCILRSAAFHRVPWATVPMGIPVIWPVSWTICVSIHAASWYLTALLKNKIDNQVIIAVPGNGAIRMSIRPLLIITSTKALFSSKYVIPIYHSKCRIRICSFSLSWYLCIFRQLSYLIHDAKKYRSRRRKKSIRQCRYFFKPKQKI